MGLLTGNDRQYYSGSEQFAATQGQDTFAITYFYASISSVADVFVYVNGSLLDEDDYSWSSPNIILDTPLSSQGTVIVILKEHKYGGYRYISLNDIVNNFMFAYVGDGKIINRANRRDVVFHTKRAIQEFSYDISRVEKIQEVELGASLTIPMPRDYVNYVSISYVDDYGVEHPIPLGRITSRPSEAISQDDAANYQFDSNDLVTTSPLTSSRFNANENNYSENYDTEYLNQGLLEIDTRYGAEPELLNKNGMFIIDESTGTFSFSSDLINKIITIKYISDGLGTDSEMKIHKLAEEAIYKYVAHAILGAMSQIPEYIVGRYKKERAAAMRNAKLRLYNLKLSEMTNVMRGKSKNIKH